jgi:pyruvate formate lyase activating enzyme
MSERQASCFEALDSKKCRCELCPHLCVIPEGRSGLCKARVNKGGKIALENYGEVSAIALDPIEKKPLRMFMPGSKVLSIGSYGCNLSCPFCQNSDISLAIPETQFIPPDKMALIAQAYIPKGSIGLAYTYNEPLVGYEYVLDCAIKVHQLGLKNVLVTNGSINPEPFAQLISHIDAANIDLKGSKQFYEMIGGSHEAVRENIRQAAKVCHVEVTWLAIPDENDSDEEMEEASSFLAGISPEIPLHITRFFPKHKYSDRRETSKETALRLVNVAHKNLKYVFAGNMH